MLRFTTDVTRLSACCQALGAKGRSTAFKAPPAAASAKKQPVLPAEQEREVLPPLRAALRRLTSTACVALLASPVRFCTVKTG